MGLEWRENLSVGNDLIDTDHKYLIDIINQAETALRAKSRSKLTAVIDSLTRYSKLHFSNEERIALAAGYPETAHLHESHDGLLKRLGEVSQELGEVWTDAAGEDCNAFLRDWLINHVIREDMLMKPYLKKLSPRLVPR